MPPRFQNKVFIIIGAAGGIGRALAGCLAAEGASLVLSDLNRDALQAIVTELAPTNNGVEIVPCDVTEITLGKQLADLALARFGRIDGFSALAGVIKFTPLQKVEPAQWDSVLDINLRSVFFSMQAIGQAMIERHCGGSMVMMSSTGGDGPRPWNVDYGVSKAGINYITKTFALEFARKGIRVNAVSPGVIDTPMWRQVDRERGSVLGLAPGELIQKMKEEIPMGRIGTPKETAALIAFLLSEESSYITGQTITIDGGFKLNHV
jgi:NAD(P)-dependent dehydrogenase (short-subunit alcohol dehydrogenase family)